MKQSFWLKKIAGFILIAAIAIPLFGLLVMTLWNNILVEVTHVQPVTFWQALGIFVLSKILFGGFKGRGGWRERKQWGKEMKEKWQHMTPEEREKMKQDWRSRCNRWGKSYNTEQTPVE